MEIKVYVEGDIKPDEARVGWISEEDEHVKRHGASRLCVDGFLEYEMDGQKGILMAYRDAAPPHSSDLWVPGGEWKRGIMDPFEALRLKMKEETNLDITDPEYLGMVSILWKESPYDNERLKEERKKRKLGEGIHDVGHVFFAKATGKLKLKTMNPPIILVTPENCDKILADHHAHDYLKVFTKESLKRVSKN